MPRVDSTLQKANFRSTTLAGAHVSPETKKTGRTAVSSSLILGDRTNPRSIPLHFPSHSQPENAAIHAGARKIDGPILRRVSTPATGPWPRCRQAKPPTRAYVREITQQSANTLSAGPRLEVQVTIPSTLRHIAPFVGTGIKSSLYGFAYGVDAACHHIEWRPPIDARLSCVVDVSHTRAPVPRESEKNMRAHE
jgi:hypothetical protein